MATNNAAKTDSVKTNNVKNANKPNSLDSKLKANAASANLNNNNLNNNNLNSSNELGRAGLGNANKNINNSNSNNLSNVEAAISNQKKNSNKSSGTSSNETEIVTVKEDSGVYEIVSENYLLLLGISSALVIMLLIYFFSEYFRVNRALDKMVVYLGYQRIQSLKYERLGKTRIGDYYVASAYNAAHIGYQMFDYTSEKMVLAVLQSGARYLEFNIYNSEFGKKAYPVVSMGYKKGEWKMMITDTPLETIFDIIAKNAFKISEGTEGVPNPDDPIFIGLNLNTNSNIDCLNLIAFLITKYFANRLLTNEYSFQNSDKIGDIKMMQLMGKVAIFASDGFQGSGLEELVNYSWDNINNNKNHAMRRLYYKDIMVDDFNANELIEFNKKGLTIVVPHEEGDFWNGNYDTNKAFDLGCQFIAMEFQYIDGYMDSYITRFKNASLIMKDDSLRAGSKAKKSTKTTVAAVSSGTPSTTTAITTSAATTKAASGATVTTKKA
jgi:hypothetical protein